MLEFMEGVDEMAVWMGDDNEESIAQGVEAAGAGIGDYTTEV